MVEFLLYDVIKLGYRDHLILRPPDNKTTIYKDHVCYLDHYLNYYLKQLF